MKPAGDYLMNLAVSQPAFEKPAIEFRGVSLSFGDLQALRDVSFTLQNGEMLFVVGNSGSGKSVLLRLAMGLSRPDSGEILIDGNPIQGLAEEKLLAIRGRLMGMVFQEDALFSGMSTYENTAYRLIEQRRPEAEIDRWVREILRFVGLEDAMEKLPGELSGGMKRRLEIARALVGWPPIMLFDEPTSGLDPINERQVLDLIIRARDLHSISSLYVTKVLYEIPYLSTHCAAQDPDGQIRVVRAGAEHAPKTRVILLEEGKIEFSGTPTEFQNSVLPAVLRITHPEKKQRE